MKRARPENQAAENGPVEQWWRDILAGEAMSRHPVYADEVRIKLTQGRLVITGEVPSRQDRDELVRQARSRIGRGLDHYDASKLRIRPRDEKRGLLTQTIVAAYGRPDTADVARTFFLEHTPHRPLRADILDSAADAARVLPAEVVEEAHKQLERGRTLLALEVDETEAFRSRELLEEDTRSVWTIAAPPKPMTSHARPDGSSRRGG